MPFSTIDLLVRLKRFPRFRQLLRQTYFAGRDPFNRGLFLTVGGVNIRVPSRFAHPPWENYEINGTRRAASWLSQHERAILVDIGCSVGLYSLLALASSSRNIVYPIDSDLVSLKATRWLCQYVGADRLHCIHGFVSEQNQSGINASQASLRTAELLANPAIPRTPESCSYVCIDGKTHEGIPTHSIDGLFAATEPSVPWFMKCDVEGAEMLVLRGADQFVRTARPQMLVSVHPPTLAGFGYNREDVAAWLKSHRYQIEVSIAEHEEHWWCSPVS